MTHTAHAELTEEILLNSYELLRENLIFTVRNGNFKGKEYPYHDFLAFLNVNKNIFDKLISDQSAKGFNYGKIKNISFTFK